MNDVTSGREHDVVWAAAGRALTDGDASGARYVVIGGDGGVLLGVVDGLGHGTEALHAADRAIETIGEAALAPLDDILSRCHERLRGTRGAVISLVRVDTSLGELEWTGVGDVDVVLIPGSQATEPRERIRLAGGVVGYNLPVVHPSVRPVRSGDTIAMATDGVLPRFASDVRPGVAVSVIAARTIELHARDSDDALVLVARPEGIG